MTALPDAPGDAVTALVARARQHALGDLPRRTAARYPDKVGLVDGDRRLTYRELDALVDAVAAALAERGLAKGDRLALLSRNCWQYVVLSFATARLGLVLVPLNFMLGAEELAYVLEHSGAVALVAQDALGPVAARAAVLCGQPLPVRARLGTVGGPVGGGALADWRTCRSGPTMPADRRRSRSPTTTRCA